MTTITTKIEKANVKKNYQKHKKVNITTQINTTKQQPNNNPATGSSTNNNNSPTRGSGEAYSTTASGPGGAEGGGGGGAAWVTPSWSVVHCLTAQPRGGRGHGALHEDVLTGVYSS